MSSCLTKMFRRLQSCSRIVRIHHASGGEQKVTTTPATPPFQMTVSLNVLNHLGINLYSNIPAVLSELVANAYDADATRVEILIGDDEIVVRDDGVGMTHDEVNGRFLNVGYDKRNDVLNPFARRTDKGRLPMGRKGIGKLSVFSIAETVEVHTARDGQRNAFAMRLPDVKAAIQDRNRASDYFPPSVTPCVATEGTTLKLRDLKKKTASTAAFLRRRLARRFAVQGERDGFVICVDGTPISVDDRDYFKKVQFLWHLGPESALYGAAATRAERVTEITNTEVEDADGFVGRVTGWIGTVEKPSDIEEQDNVIVLLARKKLIHEDILRQFQEAGIYADYLVGEISADFLDEDDREDVVTSDRQRIKEDDPRYEALREYLTRNVLKRIQGEWTDLRLEVGRRKAVQNPVVAEWLESHAGDTRRFAERMLARVETFKFVDDASKTELYKASILGFERLALRDSLSALERLEKQEDFDATMRVLASVDELEAAHYHQIVKSRLDVIKTLKAKLPTDRERVVQRYLFNHLWLLDPAWERATNVVPIEEEAIKTAFRAVDAGLTPEEASGRVDIRFQKMGGEHVIIELKKYDRRVTTMELLVQVRKYVSALRKCLTAQFGQGDPTIRAFCIVGERPEDWDDTAVKMMEATGAKVITYHEMIAQAEAGYAEYLERDTKVGSIARFVERLEQALTTQEVPASRSVVRSRGVMPSGSRIGDRGQRCVQRRLSDVRHDRPADDLTQDGGNGVADLSPLPREDDLVTGLHELVVVRERLEDRPLPQAQAPVLRGMDEAAGPDVVELGRHRRRGGVRVHPAVDRAVRRSGSLLVTGQLQFFRPVRPGSLDEGSLRPRQILFTEPVRPVERVERVDLAVFQLREMSQRRRRRRVVGFGESLVRQLHGVRERREQHQAPAGLRDAVGRAEDPMLLDRVARLPQGLLEFRVDGELSRSRQTHDVLHADHVRPHGEDQLEERAQGFPFRF